MNKYHSETDSGNLIKSIEFNICIVLLRCFMEFLSIRHCLRNEQTLLFITNIIIIIIILESAVQGPERVRTLYQSIDPNPTQPTHGRKKKIKQ